MVASVAGIGSSGSSPLTWSYSDNACVFVHRELVTVLSFLIVSHFRVQPRSIYVYGLNTSTVAFEELQGQV